MEPVVIEITAEMKNRLWEKGAKPYFAASRFYNPTISDWCMSGNTVLCENDYHALHKNYLFGLSYYANGIIKKDLKEIFKGLELLHEALRNFAGFIFFNSAFQNTVFLVNPKGRIRVTVKHPKMPEGLILRFPEETPLDFNTVKDFPLIDDDTIKLQIEPDKEKTDFVGAVILPEQYALQQNGLTILHESSVGKRPRDKLIELFDGREEVKTQEIGSLRCTNPFSELLSCAFDPKYYTVFKNAPECLINAEFNSEWRSIKKKQQLKKLPEIPCAYCKNLFTPNSKKQKYCNTTCRNKAFRDIKTLTASKANKI
jgi:hypothetical protein